MKKTIRMLSIILLITGCSSKILKPAMELTLVDKVSNKPITQAINTEHISLNKTSKIVLNEVIRKKLPAPSGVHYISRTIGISAKGYKPQYCLCTLLNTYDRECKAREVKFTRQEVPIEMSQEELSLWLKSQDKYINALHKVFREFDYPKQVPVFCSEDTLFIK